MYNKAIIMGRIVNDLELKTTPQGSSVVSFRVAVDRRFQNKGEEKKTDFLNVVAWKNNADFICQYFSKGRMILIEGEIQTRQYQDKNGNTVYITEIIVDRACFTGEKKADAVGGYSAPALDPANASASQLMTPPMLSPGKPDVVVSGSDDDYPF